VNPLLLQSATELARRIRAREVTSREVVDVHIAQVRAVNGTLNAVVRDRFEAARGEARLADERTLREDPAALPPLHGVPCSVKECFAVEGMPQSAGLVARRDVIATTDATTVARMRAAGAIPLGVTNVSELCMWMETNNRVYGRTNNPYDPSRIVGGSSGGEGAIVGAGGVPVGLGSDIGGSIRMPAFFNGVFGHKPTGGLVPSTGQYPVAHGPALRYHTTGPLARRAEDLMPLLRILAGPDGEDAECTAQALGDPGAVDLASLTVLDVEDNGDLPVSDDLRAAQRACAEALQRRGAQVERARIDGLKASLDIWGAMVAAAGGPSFASMLGDGPDVAAWRELARWVVRRSPHTLPAIGLALFENVPKLAPARARRAVELGAELYAELDRRIGPRGIMLLPSYPRPAPRHYMPLFPPFQWTYTAILNVMEMPATQVPLGLNRRGLPLGVQVAARRGNDHLTIAVALELERAFGGWVPPPVKGGRGGVQPP
jgi:fatty acid amide hydrolase 2